LVHITRDELGIKTLQTGTLQKSVLWLLEKVVEHALTGNDQAARVAVATFLGFEVTGQSSKEVVAGIYEKLAAAMSEWTKSADLKGRTARVAAQISKVDPDIMSLIEYDDNWRQMQTQKGDFGDLMAKYSSAAPSFRKLNAQVFFKKGAGITDITGEIPAKQQDLLKGMKNDKDGPKSISVAVLQHDGRKILVAAIHLESGPKKTSKRTKALQKVNAFVGSFTEEEVDGVIVAGDFNGERQEFVANEVATQCGASSSRPAITDKEATICGVKEARWSLKEVSSSPEAPVLCTRAEGNCNVIDYIVASAWGSTPEVLFDEEGVRDFKGVAGKMNAVKTVGSDHLPVAATISFAEDESGGQEESEQAQTTGQRLRFQRQKPLIHS